MEWTGEERRKGPDPAAMRDELKAVRQDVGRLAQSVATLGSEERLKKALDSVVAEDQRHRQRILVTIVVGLLVVGSLAAVGVVYSEAAKEAADKAKVAATASAKVADYVDHCLVHPSEATPGECGNAAATGQQSTAVLALFCYLRIDPADRDDANARECFQKATAEARAASAATTTTTTRRNP